MNASQRDYDCVILPIEDAMVQSIWRVTRDPDDAEEAMQNTLLTVWRQWSRICTHANPRALVLRICLDSAYDVIRKRAREGSRREGGSVDASLTGDDCQPIDAMMANRLADRAPAEVEGRLRACLKDFRDCFRDDDAGSRRDGTRMDSARLALPRSSADVGYYRHFTVTSVDHNVVIEVTEAFLQSTLVADLFKVELLHLARLHEPQRLVIDLRQVKLVSSSVIAALIYVQSRLGHCRVLLCGMSDSLQNVFRTLNLESVFEIASSVDKALDRNSHDSEPFPTEGPVSPPGEDY